MTSDSLLLMKLGSAAAAVAVMLAVAGFQVAAAVRTAFVEIEAPIGAPLTQR